MKSDLSGRRPPAINSVAYINMEAREGWVGATKKCMKAVIKADPIRDSKRK